jgi:gamma-glutamyltranspeptidase/glutathione hydrolase
MNAQWPILKCPHRIFLYKFLFVAGLFVLSFSTGLPAQTYSQRGMVVSSSKPASEVGVEILRKGGNAIDASIATAFALAVTLPSAGNIGGGGFMVHCNHKGEATSFDFREKAPLRSDARMFLNKEGILMEESNHRGLLSIGVPGTVAGLYLAHQKLGKLPWKELVQPAIELAEKGFPMSWALYMDAKHLRSQSGPGDFMHHFFEDGSGQLTQPGQLWKQPALANTLTMIRDHGPDGFYKGVVAKKIAAFMADHGGLITLQDLWQYTAIERAPVHGTFQDFHIYSMAPPSSGGVALIQMLNMLEPLVPDSIPFNSADYVHFMAELMRRAFADRAKFMGDPDCGKDIPIEQLTSKTYARQSLGDFRWDKASVSDSAACVLQPDERDHTTHLSVVDAEGNAVSLTYTLEDWYGSKVGINDLGFIFNNEMGDFNPVPGVTLRNGQIGTEPNLIAPGKRMLSSMTPTIVLKDEQVFLVVGSPGGRTIINTVFQTIVNVLFFHMTLPQAIGAMKIHHQWLPDEIVFEQHLMSPDTQKALERRGHRLRPVSNLGSLMGIVVDRQKQVLIGAADASAVDGAAIGY